MGNINSGSSIHTNLLHNSSFEEPIEHKRTINDPESMRFSSADMVRDIFGDDPFFLDFDLPIPKKEKQEKIGLPLLSESIPGTVDPITGPVPAWTLQGR